MCAKSIIIKLNIVKIAFRILESALTLPSTVHHVSVAHKGSSKQDSESATAKHFENMAVSNEHFA